MYGRMVKCAVMHSTLTFEPLHNLAQGICAIGKACTVIHWLSGRVETGWLPKWITALLIVRKCIPWGSNLVLGFFDSNKELPGVHTDFLKGDWKNSEEVLERYWRAEYRQFLAYVVLIKTLACCSLIIYQKLCFVTAYFLASNYGLFVRGWWWWCLIYLLNAT